MSGEKSYSFADFRWSGMNMEEMMHKMEGNYSAVM